MSSSKLSSYDAVNKIWRGPTRPSIFNTEAGLGFIILNVLKQNPDRVMQVCDDSGAEMTCGEMHSRTVKISNFLISKTELKQNDVVGIVARNSENIAAVAFACFTLGLPINPLAPVMGKNEMIEMFSKTKPKAIFCDFDLIENVKKAVEEIQLEYCKIFTLIEKVGGFEYVDDILSNFDGNIDDFEPQNLFNISSTPLVILSSSGTTGSIKGITRSHQNFISQVSTLYTKSFGENNSCFFSTSLHWLTAVHLLISSALHQIKRVITTRDVTLEVFKEILRKRKITSTMLAPYVCKNLIKYSNDEVFEDMKSIFIGGAVVLGLSFDRLQKIFPNAVLRTGYGCSEADFLTFGKALSKLGSSGIITENNEIKIIDESGNSLGPNEKGQICFKKPIMFDGYFGDPEMTKTAFDPDGWCYTGDVGYFDDDGYIFVIDRVKHMLKFNHIIFTPLEIEKVIEEIDGVLSSCVVGVYDEGNDIIFAFVIKNEKFNLSEKFIENYVNEKVIDTKKIRGGVHFLKEFPLTTTGKVKNRELKEIAEKIHKEKI